jgi:hypothetical protein
MNGDDVNILGRGDAPCFCSIIESRLQVERTGSLCLHMAMAKSATNVRSRLGSSR